MLEPVPFSQLGTRDSGLCRTRFAEGTVPVRSYVLVPVGGLPRTATALKSVRSRRQDSTQSPACKREIFSDATGSWALAVDLEQAWCGRTSGTAVGSRQREPVCGVVGQIAQKTALLHLSVRASHAHYS